MSIQISEHWRHGTLARASGAGLLSVMGRYQRSPSLCAGTERLVWTWEEPEAEGSSLFAGPERPDWTWDEPEAEDSRNGMKTRVVESQWKARYVVRARGNS